MQTSFIRKILYKIIIIFLLCFLLQAHSHAVPQYILEDLGGTIAYGINESGQVVGFSIGQAVLWDNGSTTILGPGYARDINESGQVVGSSNEKGVLWENGSINDLGTTGVDASPATAINNQTHVVGFQHTSSTDGSSPYHAWLWDSANGLQDIDTTGESYALDINDNEIVVGRFGSPAHYPAIWQNGVMTPLSTSEGQAQGINNLNQVVGAEGPSSKYHAFLWEDGSMTDLGTIGTANSDAKAINKYGQVVGQLTFPGGVEYAMFWQDSEMFDLNDLISSDSDFVLTNAFDINNKGQIVGVGTINGERHAFLLTPIPEDTDGDGIPDDEDACPFSDLNDTVEIDGCDSGVENVLLEDGCTISDLIWQCAEDAKNHGEFVSAVSHTTNSLKKEGIISGKDKGKIQKGAAKADIP